jgi:hypothetical protein
MERQQKNPSGATTPLGGQDQCSVEHDQVRFIPLPDPGKVELRVQIHPPNGPTFFVPKGRQAQTLRMLLDVGERGFTKGEASPFGWARNTGDYIFRLRKLGIPIDTISELLSDGTRIGRYRLAAPTVEIMSAEKRVG